MRCVQLHVCIVVLHILGIGIEVDLDWSSISIEFGLELKTAGGKEGVRGGVGVKGGGRMREGGGCACKRGPYTIKSMCVSSLYT